MDHRPGHAQRFGENPRRGGFADAANACKEISLGDPPIGEGIAQRRDDRLLADQTGEVLGAPLPGESLIRHVSWIL